MLCCKTYDFQIHVETGIRPTNFSNNSRNASWHLYSGTPKGHDIVCYYSPKTNHMYGFWNEMKHDPIELRHNRLIS